MPASMASMESTLSSFQACMMCCVTIAMPIHFINGKCHMTKLKSCRTSLTNHTASVSYQIMPLVILIPSMAGIHT